MSVSNLITRAEYAGNGATTSFPVPFALQDNSQISVARKTISTGIVEVLTPGGEFSFTGNPATAAVFGVAPTTDQLIFVVRTTKLQQIFEFLNNTAPLSKNIEGGLDRLLEMIQEVNDGVIRSLHFPVTAGDIDPRLPDPVPSTVLTISMDGLTMEWTPQEDFIGPEGPQGVSGTLAIGDVTDVPWEGTSSVSNVGTPENAILDFVLRAGPKGDQGDSTVLVTVSEDEPDDNVGSDGDMWFLIKTGDALNGNVYQRVTGEYVLKGNILGPPGGVDSFNTRTGAVVPAAGDYSADMVTFDPTGSTLTATDVNGALKELDGNIGTVASGLNDLNDEVDLKASQSDLTALTTTVSNLSSDLGDLIDEVDLKASQEDLDALELEVANKQDDLGEGNEDDILAWKSGAPTWITQPPALPVGGSIGQVLTKDSSTDGDASWKDNKTGGWLPKSQSLFSAVSTIGSDTDIAVFRLMSDSVVATLPKADAALVGKTIRIFRAQADGLNATVKTAAGDSMVGVGTSNSNTEFTFPFLSSNQTFYCFQEGQWLVLN